MCDKIQTVETMRQYLIVHANDIAFSFEVLYASVGYSKRHADRIFKELLGKTPKEYLKNLKLSNSSQKLFEKDKRVLDIALETDYDTHEGYCKAFSDVFGVSPSTYRKGKTPIPLFIPYPVKGYYEYKFGKEENNLKNKTCLCMIFSVKKPARKLLLLRSKKAHDYWSYCEEKGCDWEGLFNSIPSKFDTAAILTLPEFLMKQGYSDIASGIELPYEYDGEVPEGYELAELPPCEMMIFESQPFKTDDEFYAFMGEIFKAIDTFDPSKYGYTYADDLAPKFNFGGQSGSGAKLAVPVKRIQQ